MQDYKVKFETLTIGKADYHIRSLLDRQQYFDPDGAAERVNIPPAMWPIFGLVWPAGQFLAETMTTFPVAGKRILEIGCGIGLASLGLISHPPTCIRLQRSFSMKISRSTICCRCRSTSVAGRRP